MKNPRVCSDANPDIVALLQAVRDGWRPPTEVSIETYEALRRGEILDPRMRAFIGFGCSFGGKWMGGFARSSKQPNFAATAARSLLQKAQRLRGATILHRDYHEIRAKGALIYCDPPYAVDTNYRAVRAFQHDEFWRAVRAWSVSNVVVVSEYNAPRDFECIAEFPTQLKFQNRFSPKERIERLFRWKGFRGKRTPL
jgi:DNA adenine methylase